MGAIASHISGETYIDAVYYGSMQRVKSYLEGGGNIYYRSFRFVDIKLKRIRQGETALHVALEQKHKELFLMLLDKWGDHSLDITPYRKQNLGDTVLMKALLCCVKEDVIREIVKKNCSLLVRDNSNRTVFHYICIFMYNPAIFEVLLNCGKEYDLNVQSDCKNTVLHDLVDISDYQKYDVQNRLKCVQLVVEHGADLTIVNRNNLTATRLVQRKLTQYPDLAVIYDYLHEKSSMK